MNRRGTVVSVRLSRDELHALREVPGDGDGARIRALIHARSLAEVITADGEKTRALFVELSKRLKEAMEQLYEHQKS